MNTSTKLFVLCVVFVVWGILSCVRGFHHYEKPHERCYYCWGWTVFCGLMALVTLCLAVDKQQLND